MYAEDKAAAYSMMKKAVREYAGTPEAQNGQKLLAEWEPIIAKEKAEREAAEARFRKHQEWRESVRRRTGHYPCQVCNGSGRGSGGYGRAGSVCSSCEGSGLER